MKRHLAALLVALLAPACLATPAAAQEPLARVSGGDIEVRGGPGWRYPVIGILPDGTSIALDVCTPESRWCLARDIGWVEGSWIVGSAAKLHATPHTFHNPFEGDPNAPWSWRNRDWIAW